MVILTQPRTKIIERKYETVVETIQASKVLNRSNFASFFPYWAEVREIYGWLPKLRLSASKEKLQQICLH